MSGKYGLIVQWFQTTMKVKYCTTKQYCTSALSAEQETASSSADTLKPEGSTAKHFWTYFYRSDRHQKIKRGGRPYNS